MPERPWTVHAARILHESVYRIEEHDVETPDGRRFDAVVVRCLPAVLVLPLTAGGDVVFVRQYRHPFARSTLELPAGVVEPGELAEDAARRELAEETLLRPGSLRRLGAFPTSPGLLDQKLELFLADGCVHDPEAQADEPVLAVPVPAGEALGLIGGPLMDASSALALLLARDALAA